MAKDNEALKQARTLSNSSVIGLSVIVFLAVAAMVLAGVLDEKAKRDSLNVRTHDKTYKENKVFDTRNGKFTFNEDSVYVRQQRELFYSEIQKMQKVRER